MRMRLYRNLHWRSSSVLWMSDDLASVVKQLIWSHEENEIEEWGARWHHPGVCTRMPTYVARYFRHTSLSIH